MLNINDKQLGSMRNHLVDDFIHSSIVFLRTHATEFTSPLDNKALTSYIKSCVSFCEDYQISITSNVHNIMLWNIDHSFLEGNDYGVEVLLSEFEFSENYRVERLYNLLSHKSRVSWRLLDDL